jgi:hypothetical protein
MIIQSFIEVCRRGAAQVPFAQLGEPLIIYGSWRAGCESVSGGTFHAAVGGLICKKGRTLARCRSVPDAGALPLSQLLVKATKNTHALRAV